MSLWVTLVCPGLSSLVAVLPVIRQPRLAACCCLMLRGADLVLLCGELTVDDFVTRSYIYVWRAALSAINDS